MQKHANQKKKKSPGLRLKLLVLSSLLLAGTSSYSQDKDPLLTDTSILDYDEIFSELDALLDSLYTPR
ncbi:MAG: hypothetical protein M3Q06_15080, partial [Bacteroidota bacterium]|nr:hypothetical protein [Bacteroidota bacterium]